MMRRYSLLAVLAWAASLNAACKTADPNPSDREKAAPTILSPPRAEIPGIDLQTLEPAVRGDALRLLNETYCYCGCALPVAACLSARAECPCVRCSDRMAGFIMNEFKSGTSAEDVEAQLLEGFSGSFNQRPVTFSETGQPEKGPKDAQLTLVEFADFSCSHCAMTFEVLEALAERQKDLLIRYYYYPLSGMGERSLRAAEAAEEARVQGKFWELAALLYRNQHALELEDVLGYATEAGLDVPKLARALEDRTHRETVLEDRRLGESLGVRSTPTLYINGRAFGLGRTLENLELRLDMERERGRCD